MPKSYSKQFSLYDSGLVLSTVEQLPTASASVAFTVDSGKVFREDADIVPVTLSNGIQYMPWGGDNLLPYHVLDMIESDETLSTCQIFFEHQTTWVVTRNVNGIWISAKNVVYLYCEEDRTCTSKVLSSFFAENQRILPGKLENLSGK